MAKKTGKVIIQNPALTAVLRGFTPVFANNQDLTIVKRLELLNKKLQGVDNEVLRGLKGGSTPRAFTSRMKEIDILERSLIAEITSRNQDF